MPHDVFISHSSKDKAVANAICVALEAAGIKCWIAPRNINPGQEWPEAIVNAVTSSKAMVLVFSRNANHSKDVAKETLMAMNMGIDLIPIKIEDAEPTGTMQYYLADSKWIDAAEQPVEEKTEELLKAIRPLVADKTVDPGQSPAAMAKPEEQPPKSEKFNLTAFFHKTKRYISIKPKLAAVLATACLLLLFGVIGILSADHERAQENGSDSQALPAAKTDHGDYDQKISGLDYDTIYIINDIKGTIPLADLEIGSRVVDPSWLWQFRTGANYSYVEGDITKPVVWIVVAKDHYENMEPHVTLLTQELIGKFSFDNSMTPQVRIGTYQHDQQVHLGSNHWGTSGTTNATHGLRPWLNNTGIHARDGFYRVFSDSFKKSIAVTAALPNSLWGNGSLYTTSDMVFIPSSTELGDTAHKGTFQTGRSYPFFIGSEAADRVAKIGNDNWAYWTRSPNSTDPYNLYCVIASGDFMKTNYAYYNHYAVRATVNLKSDTKVYELTK